MTEELNNILEGKTTLIKNKQYLSARAYIEPFIKRMDEFKATYKPKTKYLPQAKLPTSFPLLKENLIWFIIEFIFRLFCQKLIIISLDAEKLLV